MLEAASLGYEVAMHNVGTFYYLGRGVVQNKDVALQWFRKAAISGYEPSREFLLELKASFE